MAIFFCMYDLNSYLLVTDSQFLFTFKPRCYTLIEKRAQSSTDRDRKIIYL